MRRLLRISWINRISRISRIARIVALVGLGVVALVAVAVVVASRTGLVQELVRRQVVAALAAALPGGEVTVAATGGSLLRSLVLEGVRIRSDGRTIVAIPRVEAVYALDGLVRRRLHIRRLTLVEPRVHLVRTPDGWRWPHPPERTVDRDGGSGFRLSVDHLEVRDGRVAVALLDGPSPRRFAAAALALDAGAVLGPRGQRVELRTLDAVPRGVALGHVAARGSFSGDGDTLALSDVEVSTARSRLVGAGRIAPGRTADARLTLAPLDVRDVRAVVPGLGVRTTTRAVLRARGPWNAAAVGLRARFQPGGALQLAGMANLDASPVAWRGIVRTRALDPHDLLDGLVAAEVEGRARAAGTGFGKTTPLTYAVRLDPSRIAGHALDQLLVRGEAAGGEHRASVRATTAAGTVAARARVDLNRSARYHVAGRVDVSRLDELESSLPGHASLRVAVIGAGKQLRVRSLLERGVVHDVELRRGDLRARLDDRRVRVTRLDLAGPVVRASATGQIDLDARTADAALHADAVPPRGRIALDATARGRLDDLAVTASAAARDVQLGGAAVERADATVDLARLGSATPTGRARLDAAGLRFGTSPARTVRADATWTRTGADDRADVTATARRGDDVSERLALLVTRTAERTIADVRELQVSVPESPPWRLARPARLELRDGTVTTTGVALASADQQLSIAGRVDPHGAVAATVELTRVRVAPICALTSGPPCTGTLGGRLVASGSAGDPRLDGTFTVASVVVDAVPYGDLHLGLRYAARRAVLDAALDHPQAGELHLDGAVPVDLAFAGPHADLSGAPVDLRLHAAHLDLTFLRALAPHTLRQTAGRLALDVRVDGPRASPHADGRVVVKDGRLELALAGMPYEEVEAELQLAGDRVEVRHLRARGGDGTIEGRGSIALAAGGPVDLGFQLHDFLAVRREAVEAEANGDLAVAGTLRAPDVHGTLEITRAIVRPALLPVSGPSLERDSTITVAGRPLPATEAETAATSGGEEVRLSIDLRVVRNVWIRRADANIELGGALHIEKIPGEAPRLSGVIRLLRGWYAFQGHRFDIDEGTIRFTGASPPEPVYDITASHRTPEYRILVRIQGAGKKPTLKLASDPPLDQADILSVLLFGKPASELGRGESVGLQRQALQLATGYVAPELRSSVLNTLGLDVFDVEMAQGTDNPGRVTAGRYVTSDVFVSLAQEFGARAAEVVGLEYGLTPRISIKGSTSTRGDSAIDLFWHRRY